MSVEFDEENNFSAGQPGQNNFYNPEGEASGLAGFLIKKGIAQNEGVANGILLGVALLFLGLTIFVIVKYIL